MTEEKAISAIEINQKFTKKKMNSGRLSYF